MKTIFLVSLALISMFNIQKLHAADYWPMTEGTTYHYINDDGYELDVEYTTTTRHISSPASQNTQTEIFSTSADGDVMLSDLFAYTYGAIDPDQWFFIPKVKFLDLPLFIGKQWSTITSPAGPLSGPTIFAYSVESESTVTVPMGTFQVFAISEFRQIGQVQQGVYYVDREIGPVILPGGYKLISIEGSVSVESTNWGSIKALYR